MKLFQLYAKGSLAHDTDLDGPFRCASQRVFRSYEEAKIYEPEFIDACCDVQYAFCRADRNTLKITIHELELED